MLFLLIILAPVTDVFAHIDGVHTGGLLEMLWHILQSPEHLMVMLVMLVVVSLLVRAVIKKRANPPIRSKPDAKARTTA
jgi:hypothetical protein